MSETITVVGNIATDPVHRTTPNGTPVTSFRVATSERRYDEDRKEWIDVHTNYYSISSFRSLALNAFASLRKGERVIVNGRLRLKAWESGERRGMDVEVDADALGHDLRWSKTQAQPAARARQSGEPAPAPIDGGAEGNTEQWADAGEDAGDSTATPALTGASLSEAREGDAGTPF